MRACGCVRVRVRACAGRTVAGRTEGRLEEFFALAGQLQLNRRASRRQSAVPAQPRAARRHWPRVLSVHPTRGCAGPRPRSACASSMPQSLEFNSSLCTIRRIFRVQRRTHGVSRCGRWPCCCRPPSSIAACYVCQAVASASDSARLRRPAAAALEPVAAGQERLPSMSWERKTPCCSSAAQPPRLSSGGIGSPACAGGGRTV